MITKEALAGLKWRLIANAIVIFTVVRFKDMHTTTNYLFANLAVTDFIFLVILGVVNSLDGMGIHLFYASGCWPVFAISQEAIIK